jgi:hypothetical protein
MAGIPLSRNFAAGKGGSLAGRLFAGTLPRPCGALQVGRSPDWLKFKLHWRCGERPASHKRSGTGGARTGVHPDALPYWGRRDGNTWPSFTQDRQMRGSRPSYLSPCSSLPPSHVLTHVLPPLPQWAPARAIQQATPRANRAWSTAPSFPTLVGRIRLLPPSKKTARRWMRRSVRNRRTNSRTGVR